MTSPTEPVSIEQALRAAFAHHTQGRLDQAEAIYRQVLEVAPAQPAALHLLGLVAHQRGDHARALELVSRAVAAAPNIAEFHGNRGVILHALSRDDEAIESLTNAVRLEPNHPDALNNLGGLLHARGQFADASELFQRAVASRPEFRAAGLNLAMALHQLRRLPEAAAAYGAALKLPPVEPAQLVEYANVLRDLGRHSEAIGQLQRAVTLRPDYAEAWSNMGNVLGDAGQFEQAIGCYRESVRLRPDLAEAHANLAARLVATGAVDEAADAARTAIRLKPSLNEAHQTHLMTLSYRRHDPAEVLEAHRAWARVAEQVPQLPPRSISAARGTTEPLRVGLVSPDFRDHPIAYFLLPLLASRDRARIAITCYSSVLVADDFTRRLQPHADAWRDIAAMTDEQAAALIRADEIDVLIDLAGLTAGGRPLIFARRPAPVQVSYLGYPSTLGMNSIAFRLTDVHADPFASTDAFYSERLISLPRTLAAYAPPPDAPPVDDAPFVKNGQVMFGSFIPLAKIAPETIELWSRVLRAVPSSRFMLMARGADTTEFAGRFRAAMSAGGVDPARIDLRPAAPFDQYLRAHASVDLLLDTFPFNGHTTICHALWMGVPAVTLAGDRFASRLGTSVLINAQLTQFIARDGQDYERIASSLVSEVTAFREMRRTMRERLRGSPLLDGAAFARDFEAAVLQLGAQKIV